ncbi:unnamed protein product [Paramecium pentaurelia]|uniref:Uncharacterized protein n=1 Tax=Paramecium pentaurelia TaxID=43138 RepID=A0A8S1WA33_9CILI|nr:unnamed protein product [Paramecium pentaurelia]
MNQFSEDQSTKPGLLQNIQDGSLITVLVAGTSFAHFIDPLPQDQLQEVLLQLHKPAFEVVAFESAFAIAQGLAISGIGAIALPDIGVGAVAGVCYVGYKN